MDRIQNMIALLSDLLRLTLDLGERQEISLREELEILGSYLEIESTRFQERLQFRRDVPDECLDALVPALLLQPLVENALRHGVDPRDFVSRVELKGRLAGDRLELEVRDHGLGMREDPGDGIGLANVRARLEQMYPGVGELVLSEPGDGGLRVIIRLPFVTTRGRRGAEG